MSLTTVEPTISVDKSPVSAVAVCRCGWRAAALGTAAAWRLAAVHESINHAGELHAAKRASEQTSRERDERRRARRAQNA